MAGKATRSKGRRGQQEFANLLRSLDWSVAELNAGTASWLVQRQGDRPVCWTTGEY